MQIKAVTGRSLSAMTNNKRMWHSCIKPLCSVQNVSQSPCSSFSKCLLFFLSTTSTSLYEALYIRQVYTIHHIRQLSRSSVYTSWRSRYRRALQLSQQYSYRYSSLSVRSSVHTFSNRIPIDVLCSFRLGYFLSNYTNERVFAILSLTVNDVIKGKFFFEFLEE